MPSAQYIKMLSNPAFTVSSDIRPWGGISPIFAIDARVDNISINPGATLDSATITYTNDEFGDEETYFLPVVITETTGAGKVLFRGFVTINEGTISESGDLHTVELKDYKWMISKRTMIRGKWYLNRGETGPAVEGLGNGTTTGDAKFEYEKFRSDIEAASGFLQNEALVFNEGGVPDCFVDNHATNNNVVFYRDTIDRDELEGVLSDNWEARDYDGQYWTWLTIIRHIHKYWIDPYNVSLAPVNLNSSDLTALAAINADLRKPIDFSVDGMTPLTAIDTVVSSIPGQWYWYLEYAAATVTIRIRKLSAIVGSGTVALEVASRGDKLALSDANVLSARVTRDASEAVRAVVGLGGKVKLVTTIKLIPLWQRYAIGGTYCDFEDAADYESWVKWVKIFLEIDKEKQDKTFISKLTAEQLKRYPRIYRFYGIPEEGSLIDSSITDVVTGTPDTIELDGDVGSEYTSLTQVGSALSATLRDYFFRNSRITREIAPPEFERYNDKIQIFMYDEYYDKDLKDSTGTTVNLKPKAQAQADIPDTAALDKNAGRRRWIIPDQDDVKISYSLDEKNSTVLFNEQQLMQKRTLKETNKDNILKILAEANHDASGGKSKAQSRHVYMTATFSTDVAAVLLSKVSSGFIESASGCPYSAYVQSRDQDIIYHQNAWYPITDDNKDAIDPAFSIATIDSKEIGDQLRRCDAFDNYRKYIGEGHYELARAIINWKEGYLNYREDVDAVLPYMELSYVLGDTLTEITNTNYTTLGSYLLGITWSRSGQSDSWQTTMKFANYYNTDRKNIGFAKQKGFENKNRWNKRVKFSFTNEVPSGSLPPL